MPNASSLNPCPEPNSVARRYSATIALSCFLSSDAPGMLSTSRRVRCHHSVYLISPQLPLLIPICDDRLSVEMTIYTTLQRWAFTSHRNEAPLLAVILPPAA